MSHLDFLIETFEYNFGDLEKNVKWNPMDVSSEEKTVLNKKEFQAIFIHLKKNFFF